MPGSTVDSLEKSSSSEGVSRTLDSSQLVHCALSDAQFHVVVKDLCEDRRLEFDSHLKSFVKKAPIDQYFVRRLIVISLSVVQHVVPVLLQLLAFHYFN